MEAISSPPLSPNVDAASSSTGDAGELRHRRLRERRRGILALVAFSFAVDTALLALFWAVGSVPGAAVAGYAAAGAVSCAIFFCLDATGLSDRARDPYLTVPGVLLNSTLILAAAAWVPQVGVLLLMVLFLVLAFGALRLSWRGAAGILTVLSVSVMAVVVNLGHLLGLPLGSGPERAISGLWVVLVMARCMMLGLYGARIRHQLNQRNRDLKDTNAEVQRLATRDDLTGLLNRRSILQCLRQEMDRHDRPDVPLGVALLDLDHFKAINDTHGHPSGDEVLRQFGLVVAREMRVSDRLGRFGGEEFLLMLNGVRSGADALQVAERMRAAIARHPWGKLVPGLSVTASVGVAVVQPGDTVDSLIARADQALYDAKHQGRNQTRLGG
jgi:diguanylate cyclase